MPKKPEKKVKKPEAKVKVKNIGPHVVNVQGRSIIVDHPDGTQSTLKVATYGDASRIAKEVETKDELYNLGLIPSVMEKADLNSTLGLLGEANIECGPNGIQVMGNHYQGVPWDVIKEKPKEFEDYVETFETRLGHYADLWNEMISCGGREMEQAQVGGIIDFADYVWDLMEASWEDFPYNVIE